MMTSKAAVILAHLRDSFTRSLDARRIRTMWTRMRAQAWSARMLLQPTHQGTGGLTSRAAVVKVAAESSQVASSTCERKWRRWSATIRFASPSGKIGASSLPLPRKCRTAITSTTV